MNDALVVMFLLFLAFFPKKWDSFPIPSRVKGETFRHSIWCCCRKAYEVYLFVVYVDCKQATSNWDEISFLWWGISDRKQARRNLTVKWSFSSLSISLYVNEKEFSERAKQFPHSFHSIWIISLSVSAHFATHQFNFFSSEKFASWEGVSSSCERRARRMPNWKNYCLLFRFMFAARNFSIFSRTKSDFLSAELTHSY